MGGAGFLGVAELLIRLGEALLGLPAVRLLGSRPVERSQRLAGFPLREQAPAQVVLRVGTIRIAPDGRPQEGLRFRVPSLLLQPERPRIERCRGTIPGPLGTNQGALKSTVHRL